MAEFPQSPLSNAGQAIALYEEIAGSITQVGTTIVTQLPQEMWHQRAPCKMSLEAHTVIYHKTTFCQTPTPQTNLCVVLEKGCFWVHYFPCEHSREKESGELSGLWLMSQGSDDIWVFDDIWIIKDFMLSDWSAPTPAPTY